LPANRFLERSFFAGHRQAGDEDVPVLSVKVVRQHRTIASALTGFSRERPQPSSRWKCVIGTPMFCRNSPTAAVPLGHYRSHH
jgi:hypothetical protein